MKWREMESAIHCLVCLLGLSETDTFRAPLFSTASILALS